MLDREVIEVLLIFPINSKTGRNRERYFAETGRRLLRRAIGNGGKEIRGPPKRRAGNLKLEHRAFGKIRRTFGHLAVSSELTVNVGRIGI